MISVFVKFLSDEAYIWILMTCVDQAFYVM
jgi:hypothetical protein